MIPAPSRLFKLHPAPTLVLLNDSDGLDLDARVAREARDTDSFSRWWIALEVLAIEFVHRVIVRHIREEHCRFKNVLGAAAGNSKYGGEIPKHCSVCSSIPPATISPVFGSTPSCPEVKTSSPATMAGEKRPLGGDPSSLTARRRAASLF